MIVGTQTLRPGTFDRHLVARKHSKKKGRRVLMASLSLTSMVDMFSLLVIFLLQAFSASPEMLISGKMELPSAISGKEIIDAPVLALTANEIFLDQKKVGDTAALLRDPTPLMAKLAELRELWQRTHPNEEFKGEINLQAHKTTSSAVVSRVMGMLPSQHYGSIQLVVLAGGTH